MIRDALYLAVELVVLFFGVTFAIQLFQRRVGAERVQAWLGGSPIVAALKGIAIGFVTPFCTFSAVPLLIGFRQAEVRTAGYVAFIVAAPVLDPILFGALALIAGVPVAITYLAIAFAAAMALAILADAIGIDAFLKPLPGSTIAADERRAVRCHATARDLPSIPTDAGADHEVGTSCSRNGGTAPTETPWSGLRAETSAAARSSARLLRSVALVLGVGITIGMFIEANVSPEMTARLTGDNSILAIPVAAVLGTPLYVNTALFVPIADALGTAGVGLGTIVALTISGAGASVPEFVLLTKLAAAKILAVFFAYILVIAVVGGLLTQAIAG